MTDVALPRRARLADRWPTALALVVVASVIVLMAVLDREAQLFGPSIAVMAGIYLMAYALGRPWTAWVAFAVLSGVMSVLHILDAQDLSWADPSAGIVAVVVLLWLWGVARRRFAETDTLAVQTAGMVAFAAVTLICAAVDPRWATVLAGVAFLAHGLWDVYHFTINKVVHRSWSEFCAVIDIPTGVALIGVGLI